MSTYTNKDFCDALVIRQGWKKVPNRESNCSLLLPWIMMGVAYTYYERNIKDLTLAHRAQYERNRFKAGYKAFNKALFDCYDLDMQDAFCDKIDAFQRWLYVDLAALQSKMMRCLPPNLSAEDKRVLSAAMLINRFAFISQCVWGRLYQVNGRFPSQNSNLNVILGSMRQFAMAYTQGNALMTQPVQDEKVADDLFAGIEAIQKKMLRFIDFDKHQEQVLTN